jgi:hypothetical protein
MASFSASFKSSTRLVHSKTRSAGDPTFLGPHPRFQRP